MIGKLKNGNARRYSEQTVHRPPSTVHRLPTFTFYLLPFAVCLFLTACDEAKEGCLDIAATNFAADADDPCEDCCTFPNLEIQFLHRITQEDTLIRFQYDSLYQVGNNQSIVFDNIQLLLSDLEFIRANGTTATVLDTIQLAIPNTPGDTTFKTRPDNFVTVNADNFQSQTIANYRESGNFVGLQFNIGVIEPDNQAVPTSLADDHPLQTDSLYLGTGLGYIFNQIIYQRDTTAIAEPSVVTISGEPLLQTIQLDTLVTLRESFDVRVVLQIDYATWLENVDLNNDSSEIIAEKITANLRNAFTLFDITQE